MVKGTCSQRICNLYDPCVEVVKKKKKTLMTQETGKRGLGLRQNTACARSWSVAHTRPCFPPSRPLSCLGPLSIRVQGAGDECIRSLLAM